MGPCDETGDDQATYYFIACVALRVRLESALAAYLEHSVTAKCSRDMLSVELDVSHMCTVFKGRPVLGLCSAL